MSKEIKEKCPFNKRELPLCDICLKEKEMKEKITQKEAFKITGKQLDKHWFWLRKNENWGEVWGIIIATLKRYLRET